MNGVITPRNSLLRIDVVHTIRSALKGDVWDIEVLRQPVVRAVKLISMYKTSRRYGPLPRQFRRKCGGSYRLATDPCPGGTCLQFGCVFAVPLNSLFSILRNPTVVSGLSCCKAMWAPSNRCRSSRSSVTISAFADFSFSTGFGSATFFKVAGFSCSTCGTYSFGGSSFCEGEATIARVLKLSAAPVDGRTVLARAVSGTVQGGRDVAPSRRSHR